MGWPQGTRITATRSGPRWSGVCDDCGFIFPYQFLYQQMQYQGNALVWTGGLVCAQCLNKPSEFLRPAILGPEPIPPKYPRPTAYSIQNEGGVPPPTSPLRLSILGDDESP